ncbi:hypothetical protein [Butyrivibrio sp. INlla16]|uniref:IS66 family insertion sequence element accessory protein TnpA n=1 Tax=Butyrivibrio sp. INlla16 TaxID=1520807 RepID=UPI0008854CE0|nr:hypothetical protein [Butyrivibrio sp. INlla16]SDB51577.1 hypothetical protein SAMN02910263_02589 [Butyrivibrio sp. INlla16]
MDKFVMDIRLESWIPIFEEQIKSGLSKHDFCRQNGISKGAFFKWQKIFREKLAREAGYLDTPPTPAQSFNDSSGEKPAFFELATTSSSDCAMEISDSRAEGRPCISGGTIDTSLAAMSITYGGFSINVSGNVDEQILLSVLKAVKHA